RSYFMVHHPNFKLSILLTHGQVGAKVLPIC
ncbi:MAG: hypothetical protein ACI861_001305, partial [Paracoccaceae bacterium]